MLRTVISTAALVFALVASAFGQSIPPSNPASDRVGATFGEFRVAESGSSTYRIPIAVPPGTAGVQPQIALAYDSAAADSVMGPGWSLVGSSAIVRCRATRESGDFIANGVPVDGDARAVRFHPEDRFCLDGQRLILVSTDLNYGDSGAEYRLETDRFTRIYSQGGNNSAYTPAQPNVPYTGPTWFKVQRRDGTTSEYGNTADSRLEANGQANANMGMVWAMNRVEDSSGNYMLFEYDEYAAAGEQLLRRIKYTGKRQLPGQTAPATLPYATITLNYEQTPVLRAAQYQSGALLSRSRLLTSITTAGARHYALTYDTSPGDSGQRVLTAVSECADSSLQVCYPPTTFEWSNARLNLTQNDGPLTAGVKFTVSTRLGDVDGDGRLDLVTFSRAPVPPCSQNRLTVYFADKRSDGSVWMNSTLGGTPICTTFSNTGPGSVDQWWQLVDYDGDGRDDLLIAENPGPFSNPTNPNARWKIHPSRGRFVNGVSNGGFDTSVDLLQEQGITLNVLDTRAQVQLADFNGDGLADLIYAIVSGNSGNETSSYYIRFLERQAGTTGFKYSAPYAVALDSWPQGHPCTTGPCSQPSLYLTAATSRHIHRPQDVDGDGRADLYAVMTEQLPNRITPFLDSDSVQAQRLTLETYYLMYRMGGRNETTQAVELEALWSSHPIPGMGVVPEEIRFAADFNADGLPDLLTKPAGYRICLNTGSRQGGFLCDSTDLTGVADGVQVVDVDGNGRADVVYLQRDVTEFDQYRYRLAGPDGRLGSTEYIFEGSNVRGRDDPDTSDTVDLFVDLDGDGLPEFVGIDPDASLNDLKTATSDASNRFRPRDVITEIVNGYGARTSITYLPLTNKDVYRPDRCVIGAGSLPTLSTCTRNKDWDTSTTALDLPGRGSPVVDALYAMYVTSHVQSDAPTFDNASARSLVSYRYVGGKLQAGGRGSLGFRELISTDHNFSGTPLGHVVTLTEYGQRFPHIGFPVRTEKFVVAGGAALSACRTTDRDKDAWLRNESTPDTRYAKPSQWRRHSQSIFNAGFLNAIRHGVRNH